MDRRLRIKERLRFGRRLRIERLKDRRVLNAAAEFWYVDDAGAAANTGLNWESPITLAEALARAESSDGETTIFVKEGTYRGGFAIDGDAGGAPGKEGLTIEGGYLDFLWGRHRFFRRPGRTIFSGELQDDGDITNNADRVLGVLHVDQVFFERFVVEEGHAVGLDSLGAGAAVAFAEDVT